jgi:hypothetical protein
MYLKVTLSALLMNLLNGLKRRPLVSRQGIRLAVELFEDRLVPADLTWIGGQTDGLWSDVRNWTVDGNQAQAVPRRRPSTLPERGGAIAPTHRFRRITQLALRFPGTA